MLIYAFVTTAMTLYLLVAMFALYMTYDEQCKAGNNNPLCGILSFLACLFWPVTVLTVAVAVQRKTV